MKFITYDERELKHIQSLISAVLFLKTTELVLIRKKHKMLNRMQIQAISNLAMQNPDYGLCDYLYARGRTTHCLEKLGRKIQSLY